MTRVLVTGAAGGVAKQLLPGLAGHYDLIRTDRVDAPGIDAVGDLADEAFVDDITRGVDAVVHLAANPAPSATWRSLREPNIDTLANLLAARAPRYVLAGSAHAMGQYLTKGRTPVDPTWPVAPCCTYGATKAFAEALGRTHAFRTGTPVVVLRLGAVTEVPAFQEVLGGWLGPADLQQLVACALEADVEYSVCHGISANTGSVLDTRNDIGYRPVLDSADYAAKTLSAEPGTPAKTLSAEPGTPAKTLSAGLPSDPRAASCAPDEPSAPARPR